mgnify:CR=1 FL=1
MIRDNAKVLLIASLIAIFCCCTASLEETNLLINGDFKLRSTGWGLGSSASLDPRNKFAGNSSIKMYGISTDTWNVATTDRTTNKISVEAGQQYILTFVSKNDSLKGIARVGIRWVAGNTTITYNWLNLRNDTDWEDYRLMVVSPQGASQAQIYLHLQPDFTGNAWFSNFVFTKAKPKEDTGIKSAGPVGFRGSVLTEISYTPEERWVAGNRLQMYTDLVFGTTSKGYIHLGGWLPREDEFHSFASLSSIPANLRIKYAYLEVDGPWLGRYLNMRTRLGDLEIAYSPFIMTCDRWELWYWDVMDNPMEQANYNRARRGISVESLGFDKITAGGFLLWDGDPGQYAYGSSLSYGTTANNLNLIFINYEDHKGNLPGEKPKKELSFSIQGKASKGPAGAWCLGAQNQKEGLNSPKNILQGGLSYDIGKFATLSYSSWSFDKDFDPRYRDRTPRYDLQTGKKLNWNPIDKFKGQEGNGVGITFNNGFFRLDLQSRQALERLDRVNKIQGTELKLDIDLERTMFSLEAEYNTNQVNEINEPLSIQKGLLASSVFKIKQTKGYSLTLVGNHGMEDVDGNTSTRSYLVLNTRFLKGPLGGASLFAGARKINTSDQSLKGFVCGLDLLVAREINLIVRYSHPNENKRLDSTQKLPRYDQHGNYILPDNIVKLSLNVEF